MLFEEGMMTPPCYDCKYYTRGDVGEIIAICRKHFGWTSKDEPLVLPVDIIEDATTGNCKSFEWSNFGTM